MKVLVIGGTGLISGSAMRLLKRQGHSVTVFHRGHTPLETPGVSEILGDRQNRRDFEAKLRPLRFDAVIDSILFTPEDAASTLRAFAGRVKHYQFVSTVCAVGAPLVKIPSDETEPYQPVSGYGRNKAAAEKLLLNAHRKSGFPVCIVRPSHTYGPGARWALGTFLSDWGTDCELYNRILRGKGVIVHGDGENLWQSCIADEVAEGMVGALARKKTLGQIYNLCGHEVVTWDQFYAKVGQALGKKPRIFHLPTEAILAGAPESATGFLKDIARYHGAYSIAKAQRDIPEFRPRTPLEKGVKTHFNWVKSRGYLHQAPPRPFEDRLVKVAASLLKK
ncbi:MAG: NAD-dependent epimerase/dehydratase family protein [candidate division FCPU426 bacterium]